ncbi:MAG: o-succinylbenzoate synthase [Flavobacterium sp.]|nr:o-succinylbenzoate synthase [Flavobacterium sp.]
MKATYAQYILDFKQPAGTSRGVLRQKETWFLVIKDGERTGIGECGLLRGLSFDDRPDYEEKLRWVCDNISLGEHALWEQLREFPSIQMGVECAFRSLKNANPYILFPSEFTRGNDQISINGLIWMGDAVSMKKQIVAKIAAGFKCLKLKIGAIDFDEELAILKEIRQNFSSEEIELRVDANGGFSSTDALYKINKLSELELHSIEQPILKNQHDIMAELCRSSNLDIALDEELIGIVSRSDKQNLLREILPQYIILKPSFVGGFRGAQEWIEIANQLNIGWWITSALESNIGLNAIAQWTYTLQTTIPQGLGTGALYTNNIASPLTVSNGHLKYDASQEWDLDLNRF